ncbi:hypothetical protein V2J09_007942 [Rumex salicifolius]
MGCFSTCFPKSKPTKSLKPRRKAPRLDQLLQRDEALEALEPTDIQDLIETPPLSKEDVPIDKLNVSGRKKVTFDPNVKIYEGFAAEDESECDILVKKDEDEKEEKEKKSQCHSDSSSSSSLFSFPPNGYRYQDCRDSDDEFDQLVSDEESDMDSYLSDEVEDDDEEEVNNDHLVVKQESSESLFSLSLDSRKHNQLSIERGDKEVNSPMPIKTAGLDEEEDEAEKMTNSDSVLNPVENLSQWKAIKARAKLASQNKAKENKISSQQSNIPHSEEPNLNPNLSKRVNSVKSKNLNQEIAVDTSLSTWLVARSQEASTPSKSKTSLVSVGNSPSYERTSSPKDYEDRPILGALTMDEIKLMSASSTPRKSPSKNPDDMPIIGSVGSYWSHTGQGTSSNSGSNTRGNSKQGSKVNFKSSLPFEKRLESVL